jgi:creatinine amidohydrolase/Fe(II)-dependent formamide hydrolase-like protein
MKGVIVYVCFWLMLPALTLAAEAPDTVFLEELTWVEVRDALKAGHTTILFPTGGTEQNGPHMVLGKHNFIVKYTAEQIARRLGNALVAPVLAYVPEGELTPPTGHMRFPGTITLPEPTFMQVTEYAARSFKGHGFKDIVLLGDSGDNQRGLQAVAARLNREWGHSDVRVHYVSAYYSANGFYAWLEHQGEPAAAIGKHAGIMDTSELMAIDPKLIRMDKLAPGGDRRASGVSGDPTRASIAYGKKGLELKVTAAVTEIQRLIAARGTSAGR